MISLVYAISENESANAAELSAGGFWAIERDGVGMRIVDQEPIYRVIAAQPPGTSPVIAGHALRAQAEGEPGVQVLQSNGGAAGSPRELWQVLEAANHPRVKIAWDAATARRSGRTAAMAVSTLNLRIGLVRLDRWDEESISYTHRLAGIGFGGWIVIDPPASSDRQTKAHDIAAAVTAALTPRKTVRAAAKNKA